MRALFVSALAGLLSPLPALASLNLSGFEVQEFSDYYLYYQDSSDYGTPAVTPGGTIRFFPTDMSVKGRRFKTDTFVTTIGVLPKADFNIASIDFLEYGDYRFKQGRKGNTAEFEVNARLFITGFDDLDFDVLAADGLYTADESTAFETWELSESYDISNYDDGFFLTIQNTLTVGTLPTRDYNPSETEGFWNELQTMLSYYDYEGDEYEDDERAYEHKNKKGKYKKKKNKRKRGNDFLQLDKKGIALKVNGSVSEVPVPAAAWLFGSALAALTVVRRRRS